MKYLLIRIIPLVLFFQTNCFSQENSKGLRLKVTEVNAIQKNGQTSWKAKAVLSNNTKDTLFYFNMPNCEQAYFMVMAYDNSLQLYSDFEKCDDVQISVTAIAPKESRKIDLIISSKNPVTTPIKFKVLLMLNKAKNSKEQIPRNDLDNLELMKKSKRHILIVSNRIKT